MMLKFNRSPRWGLSILDLALFLQTDRPAGAEFLVALGFSLMLLLKMAKAAKGNGREIANPNLKVGVTG